MIIYYIIIKFCRTICNRIVSLKTIDLYSFNPPYLSNDSFYEKTILEDEITDNIINIPEFLNNSNNTLSMLSINELTKYLIFLLFILLFIEMALSNVKTSSRND